MKKMSYVVAGAVMLASASIATAGFVGGQADFVDTGGTQADGPIAYLDVTVNLPDISSLDSVELELAHDFGSDLHIAIVAPDSTIFTITRGQASTLLGPSQYDIFGPFNGGFTATHLGDGGGFGLDNVVNYTLASAGGSWLDDGDPLPGGTYAALEFPVGGYAAGEWRLVVLDVWPTVDFGALGAWRINYSAALPAPGAIALLGLAGLCGTRRRRA